MKVPSSSSFALARMTCSLCRCPVAGSRSGRILNHPLRIGIAERLPTIRLPRASCNSRCSPGLPPSMRRAIVSATPCTPSADASLTSDASSTSISWSNCSAIEEAVDQYTTPNRTVTDNANNSAWTMASRKLVPRKRSGRRTQAVSYAANSDDQFVREALIDLVPQATDMRFHDRGLRVEVKVPNLLEEHRPGNDLTGITHQEFQQLEFARLQIDFLAGSRHSPLDQIHLQVARPQDGRRPSGNRSAAKYIDARQQLGERERLHELVVAAGVQADNLVVDTGERAEKPGSLSLPPGSF